MREDWIEVELGEIVDVNPTLPNKQEIEKSLEVQFVPMKLVAEAVNQIHLIETREFADVAKGSYTPFINGDIIFAKVTPCMENGKIAITDNLKNGIGFGSSEFHVIRCSQIKLNRYLYYFITQGKFRNDAKNAMTGAVGLRRVPKKFIEDYTIPLAPLPIQRAIVSKIEALFSDLDNGIANFKKAQEQLKIYRQAVLKKAFEGELTREWREKQTNLPTAEELLQQIKQERQTHYNQQIEEWKKAVTEWEKDGKVEKKPSKPTQLKELPPLKNEELENLAILPKTMIWSQLGNVLWSLKDGPHYSPKYSTTGVPFISGGNIRPEKIDFEKAKYISEDLHRELSRRCKPEINDILYTKGGTTGIAKVNTYNFEFNVWVHVAVLKPIQMIVPLYLQHVLNSSHCYKQSQIYTHGVGNQDLGLTRMVHITLPVCSTAEQIQIVQEIERRLSVCDKMEQSIKESLEKAEALRQSILKKAFEGKLLTEAEIQQCKQEADYEPASELLKKIQAEKVAKGQATNKKKRKE